MFKRITAIILNYKKYEDMREAVLSLQAQTGLLNTDLQIVVIDNNSESDCTSKIEAEFPQYSYVYNKENVGFARGVNQGIKLSYHMSDYFLLVNNDAVLSTNCLSYLLEAGRNGDIAGPVIFYKKHPEIIWQGGGFFDTLKMGIRMTDKNQELKSYLTSDVEFLSGCILLIPKTVIEKVGLFDERFFFYGEDLDYCLRARKLDIRMRYARQAHAWHNIDFIAKSRTSPFVLKNLAIAYFLIIRKHFPLYRIYGLLLFIFCYTPFRLWQTVRGGGQIGNMKAWLEGGKIGWQTRI